MYNKSLKSLKRAQQALSRKQKASCNRKKAKLRVEKKHRKIKNIRRDFLHKVTTEIILSNDLIGIEKLNVKGMIKNRRLARHIMDQGFYEFRRQMTYKSELYGSKLYVADMFYPSSKLCSSCQKKNEALTLKDRHWTCECGIYHDRDINAAKNLERMAKSTVSSTGTVVIPQKLVEREALAC